MTGHDLQRDAKSVSDAAVKEGRTVVFVGGTSYSGSTMLDMMLANDDDALSCGEVYAIFHPFRRHHLNLDQLASTIDWPAIKRAGAKHLYHNLFDRFPSCRLIVDSSKSPIWISERTADLQAAGIKTKNILIWKTPNEFIESRRKRQNEQGWDREWVNYHRYYFELIHDWRGVRYRDLVTNPSALQAVCEWVGVPYFPGKERYWDRPQQTVFGNDTTKIHLHDESSSDFSRVRTAIQTGIGPVDNAPHRAISYRPALGDSESSASPWLHPVRQMLENFDCCNEQVNFEDARALGLGRLHHIYQLARLKWGLGWVADALHR